jgi:nicotinate-nucleotide--dimethylbenzimidazole phosphoribosyltransferase
MSIQKTLENITAADPLWRDRAKDRINSLTMPPWALGRLLDLAVDIAGMTRSFCPPPLKGTVVVAAGDHGVVEEGVSAFPQEVTIQMIHNFIKGGAGVNVLAGQAGARVVVVDVGVAGDLKLNDDSGILLSRRVASGTGNIARGPAMSREQALRSIEAGIDVALEFADSTDIFATGEMGIGNTTPSSAIISVLCGLDAGSVTGAGSGIDDEARGRKAETIKRAIELNRPDPKDPVDVLAKVGGYEIGAIAGLVLGAAAQRKPVIIDGLITTAGALLARGLDETVTDYIIASHKSAEPGHVVALERLGKKPLLDLNLRLGEGTGAVLAMHLVEASMRILNDMATFEEAQVSGKGE